MKPTPWLNPTQWIETAGAGLVRTTQAGQTVLTQARKLAQSLGGLGKSGPDAGDTRFTPPPAPVLRSASGFDDGEESDSTWGFADTRFVVGKDGHVQLSGNRYSLCGEPLPNLLPWIRGVMGTDIRSDDTHAWTFPPAQVPEPKRNEAFNQAIAQFLKPEQWSEEPLPRLRRGHGHTQEEMYAIKFGELGRIPDLVVWPGEESQVQALVQAALAHDVSLIPYGGGTNVTDALRCPANENRTIVSVDMRRMNRILWIDPVNRMACIQAGAVGRHLQTQLAEHGFTMGHEPDSVEFSTLGGWIATHASGMKKNKYGNIEDLVLDMTVVTASGTLHRASAPNARAAQPVPRESVGIDPRLWLFGSEGKLGIITSAVVKLFPLPEEQRYGSVLFPDFDAGVAFMYELAQAGNWPASVRLVDNLQFQFSMALKPASKGWRARKSKVEKLFVTKIKGFDPEKMVACTLVFEGPKADVEAQEAAVYAIATRHGGMKAGSENGAKGYQLTFGIAYIRDFVMDHWVLAESFETSVPWSQVTALISNVKRTVYEEHSKRGLPGTPFVTARVTQVYETGCAVYFYMAYYYKGVPNPVETYLEIETAARYEILRSGGSLSHHHGVGKLRQGFLKDVLSPTALQWHKAAKQALDPQNVFGAGNQIPAETHGEVQTSAPAAPERKKARKGTEVPVAAG